MKAISQRFDEAARSALHRISVSMGEILAPSVDTQIIRRDRLWAEVGRNGETPLLQISSGTIEAIDALAEKLVESPLLTRDDRSRTKRFAHDADLQRELAASALEWLVLHELMHYRLGHIEIGGRISLVEIEGPASHPEPGPRYAGLSSALSAAELARVRPCLELQADNDASDVLFGPFNKADWDNVRLRAAAAFMVMMLIERESEKIGARGLTHPLAATRFFQLSAQLVQFWMYANAALEQHAGESRLRRGGSPQDDLPKRYRRDLFTPVIMDAVIIAAAVGSASFIAEISGGGALIHDIEAAQNAPDLDPDRFATPGAREWAALLPINEKIMAVTGLRRWSEPGA